MHRLRSRKRTLWAAALTVAASVVGGCGTQAATPVEGSPPVESADAQLTRIEAQVFGTTEQQRARRFLGYVDLQANLESCYANHGATYTVPAFDDLLLGVTVQPGPGPTPATEPPANAYFAQISNRIRVIAPDLRRSAIPSSEEVKTSAAATACSDATGGSNQVSTPLGDTWYKVLTTAAEASGADAALDQTYGPCMKVAGITATEPSAVEELVAQRFEPFLQPSGPAVDSAAWDDAVGFEAQAFQAHVRCAAPAHDAFAVAVASDLNRFEAAHEDDLSRSERQWETVESRARVAAQDWYAHHPGLLRTF